MSQSVPKFFLILAKMCRALGYFFGFKIDAEVSNFFFFFESFDSRKRQIRHKYRKSCISLVLDCPWISAYELCRHIRKVLGQVGVVLARNGCKTDSTQGESGILMLKSTKCRISVLTTVPSRGGTGTPV